MPRVEGKGRVVPKREEVVMEEDDVEIVEEVTEEVIVKPTKIIASQKTAPAKVVELAVPQENPGYYYHELRVPISYDGVEFSEIHFDFEAMNGQDLLGVEEELARKNKISLGVELSKVNQYLLAVRAANKMKEENGFTMTSDLLEQLPMADFNSICNATRRFFTQ